MSTVVTQNTAPAFRHEALFYSGLEGFVEGTVPFLREGVQRDEAILVVVSADKIARLRLELGRDAEQVRFADMAHIGVNPARIIPAWRDFVQENVRAGRRMRGIGEPIWAARSPAELVECQLHESLLNVAFEGERGFILLCPYDVDSLGADVIAEAQASHPHLVERGSTRSSDRYRGLDV